MHRILVFLLLFALGCATSDSETLPSQAAAPEGEGAGFAAYQFPSDPYAIHFSIVREAGQDMALEVRMELYEDSHFVSPFSSRRFKGRFDVSIAENDYLDLGSDFTETPRSREEYDPHRFVRGYVNWVRVNTTYRHRLKVMQQTDFEVEGLVTFTIEPRCTKEDIPFVISYHNGELTVKKK